MREVTFRVRHRGKPESDVSAAHPEVTLQPVSSLTGSAKERKRIIEVTGPSDSITAFLNEFAATDPILNVEPLTPITFETVLVAITYNAANWDSISERLSDLGVHYRTGTSITAGWEQWTIYLEHPEELSTVQAALKRGGNDVTLVKSVEFQETKAPRQLDAARLLDDLTPRQRETLATAIAEGYYQHKRQTSIEALADHLGIGRTTTWEHLSRAEQKVMEGLADYLNKSYD